MQKSPPKPIRRHMYISTFFFTAAAREENDMKSQALWIPAQRKKISMGQSLYTTSTCCRLWGRMSTSRLTHVLFLLGKRLLSSSSFLQQVGFPGPTLHREPFALPIEHRLQDICSSQPSKTHSPALCLVGGLDSSPIPVLTQIIQG